MNMKEVRKHAQGEGIFSQRGSTVAVSREKKRLNAMNNEINRTKRGNTHSAVTCTGKNQ